MPEDIQPRQGMSGAKKGAAWVVICCTAVAGYEGIRRGAYSDPVGIPTICFGYTHGVKLGDTKSLDECKALLADEVLKVDGQFQACAGQEVVEGLPPKVRASVNSLIYNTGPGKKGIKDGPCELKKTGQPSTMIRLLMAHKWEQACQEFPKWANPPLPGIVKRRNDEMKMCLEGVKEWNSTLSELFSSESLSS
jgi:lysozyme